jgi:release factor glutamine methyltransferase
MHCSARKVFFKDYSFIVTENVYVPAEDTFLFADNLCSQKADSVVDMGTGCGILGIIAAKKAAEVFAVDVNPYAVNCARENAVLNGVADKMFFVRGDLFSAISTGRKFSLILFNAPYLPVENEDDSWLGSAWSGGVSGKELTDRFIAEASEHLKPKGKVMLMQSSLSGVEETMRSFSAKGFGASVVASRNLPFFETIVLISARRK